jgi:hypothetical protein
MEIFFDLVIIFLFLIITFVILFFYKKTNQRIDDLLEGGKIAKNSKLEKDIKEAFAKIKDLENISKITVQKTGIVRFNPFKELGGNQSFAMAILDKENNGFVISSLFVKDGNRVYAKAIKNGKSEHLLSDEEKKAIEKAIKK